MRKRTINPHSEADSSADERWLNLDPLAQVEITSESAEHPIESALLLHDQGSGWRAAQPGKQTIRVIFNQPLSLGLIFLRFEEEKQERTQEFVLRMILEVEGQRLSRNIVRQQYTSVLLPLRPRSNPIQLNSTESWRLSSRLFRV